MSKKLRMILILTFLIQTTTFSVDFIQKKIESTISLTNNSIPQMITGEKKNKEAFNKLMSKLQKSIDEYNSNKENRYKLSFRYILHSDTQDENIQNFIFGIYANSYIKIGTLTMDINRKTGEMKNINYKEAFDSSYSDAYEDGFSEKWEDFKDVVGEIVPEIADDVGTYLEEEMLPELGEMAKETAIEAVKGLFKYLLDNPCKK